MLFLVREIRNFPDKGLADKTLSPVGRTKVLQMRPSRQPSQPITVATGERLTYQRINAA
jgi:hypothetical protein